MLTTHRIELPDRLITVEGSHSADIANMILRALPGPGSPRETVSRPCGQTAPATNAEEPLAMPTLNWDDLRHVSGPTAAEQTEAALSNPQTDPMPRPPANYSGMGPVPNDCEDALEVPAMNFAKQTESFSVPITGKASLPVGEEAMALPVFK